MTEYEIIDTHQWWCPSEERWSDCPGPCPDGQEHIPDRWIKEKGVRFEIPPDHPLYGKAPYGIQILNDENNC